MRLLRNLVPGGAERHVGLLALLAVAAILAGCASARASGDPATVRIAVNAVAGGKNDAMVAWLTEVLPDVERKSGAHVQIVQDGGGDESFKSRLVLDLQGGTGADIYSFDSLWTAQMASAGHLLALDPWLKKWSDWPRYPAAMRGMGAYRGHTYVLPFQTDVRGIYYRKDLFAKAGLPTDWHPKSFQDIYAAGEALRKLDGVTPIQWNATTAFGEAATLQGFYLALLGAGGDLFDAKAEKWVASSPALRAALEFYRQVYVERGLGDVALQLDPKGRERSFEAFRDGRMAIYPEGTYMWRDVLRPDSAWGIPDRDAVVGWAPMPGTDGPVSISGGDAFILNKNARNRDLAWKVLAALASADSLGARMRLTPFIPARADLLALPAFRADAELAREVEQALPVTRFRPGYPAYPRVSELVQRMAEKVIQRIRGSIRTERIRGSIRPLALAGCSSIRSRDLG